VVADSKIKEVHKKHFREGDVAGLTLFLKAVETGDPLLTVTALSVMAPDPNARTEALRMELDLAGYYLARGAR